MKEDVFRMGQYHQVPIALQQTGRSPGGNLRAGVALSVSSAWNPQTR